VAHSFQQPIARLAGCLIHDQRLLHERGQQIEDVGGQEPVVSSQFRRGPVRRFCPHPTDHGPLTTDCRIGADRFRRFQVPAAGEHRQLPQQASLRLAEEVVAPLDECSQRLVTRQRCAAAPGEQAKPVIEPVVELLDRQRLHAGCRQLDRQRNTVQPLADLDDSERIRARQRESGLTQDRAINE
jgi:hypothetical protein